MSCVFYTRLAIESLMTNDTSSYQLKFQHNFWLSAPDPLSLNQNILSYGVFQGLHGSLEEPPGMVFLLPRAVRLLPDDFFFSENLTKSGVQRIKRITNISFRKGHGSFLPVHTQTRLEAPGLRASMHREDTCREIGSIRETNATLKVSGF